MSQHISVLLHTSEFRGDHAADVVEAHELNPGETVQELVERLLPHEGYKHDYLALRRVTPSITNTKQQDQCQK